LGGDEIWYFDWRHKSERRHETHATNNIRKVIAAPLRWTQSTTYSVHSLGYALSLVSGCAAPHVPSQQVPAPVDESDPCSWLLATHVLIAVHTRRPFKGSPGLRRHSRGGKVITGLLNTATDLILPSCGQTVQTSCLTSALSPASCCHGAVDIHVKQTPIFWWGHFHYVIYGRCHHGRYCRDLFTGSLNSPQDRITRAWAAHFPAHLSSWHQPEFLSDCTRLGLMGHAPLTQGCCRPS